MAPEPDRDSLGPRVRAPVRVVVLGMPCAFTRAALAAFLDALLATQNDTAGLDLAAIVLAVPGAQPRSDLGRPAGFAMVPDDTPIWHLGARAILADRAWLVRLDALAPDAIVSACFPWRIPQAVLGIPRRGGFNIHPSLLPAGRGPEPVFWAFRWGLRETGVTVHRMERGLDTGPILAQETVPIGDDATIPSLEAELASRGGALARRVIADLRRGAARSASQSSSVTPWARIPGPDDLAVTTAWAAVDAARFIRAVSPVHGRIGCVVIDTGRGIPPGFHARDIVEVREDDEEGAEPVSREGDTMRVRFTPGTIRFRIVPDAAPLILHSRTAVGGGVSAPCTPGKRSNALPGALPG